MKTVVDKKKNKRKKISNYLQEATNFYLGSMIENTEKTGKTKSIKSRLNANKTWIDEPGFSMSPLKAKRLVKLFNQLSYTKDRSAPREKKTKWQSFKKKTNNFLAMLSQKRQKTKQKTKQNVDPVFNFTNHDGSVLPKKTIHQIENRNLDSKLRIAFTPLKLSDPDSARRLGFSPNGGRYYTDMKNSKFSVSIRQSPLKDESTPSPHRELFKNEKSYAPLHMDLSGKTKKITFTVTKAKILKRIGVPRPGSQNKLFGISAYEYLKKIGLYLKKKQDGRDYHWAHRQGWSLGGPHSKENMDPMTAGANYATLFKVEEPLMSALFKGLNGSPPVDSVEVTVEITYAEEKDIPFKITYQLSWGDNHHLEIYIDPLNDRVPTLQENVVAKKYGFVDDFDEEFPLRSPLR